MKEKLTPKELLDKLKKEGLITLDETEDGDAAIVSLNVNKIFDTEYDLEEIINAINAS